LHRPKKLARRALKIGASDFQWLIKQGKPMSADKAGAFFEK
jgi:hypothetical protein